MSRTLHALTKTLQWQRNELNNKLLSIEQQLLFLEQQLHLVIQNISSSYSIPPLIVPEHEIARSHFMIQQQQCQHELMINKEALHAEQQALTKQHIRLNTTLKRLEKHQETTLRRQKIKTGLTEQNNRDEWTLQNSRSEPPFPQTLDEK